METDLAFAHAAIDVINGFNELERQAMRAAIVADPRLYFILPLYGMLYADRVGELCYFDEDGNHSHTQPSRRGVRQGCVLGLSIFCVTMAPTYKQLKEGLWPKGMLVTFSDDVYLHGPPMNVAATICAAPALFMTAGLRFGWGPAKSVPALPPFVEPKKLPPPPPRRR
jgi:hypothetical protein